MLLTHDGHGHGQVYTFRFHSSSSPFSNTTTTTSSQRQFPTIQISRSLTPQSLFPPQRFPLLSVPSLLCLPSTTPQFRYKSSRFRRSKSGTSSSPYSSIHCLFDLFINFEHCLKESVHVGKNESYQQWDSLTAKFSAAANFPFLLLQMPQIILNARNLLSGNKLALSAVPWLVG